MTTIARRAYGLARVRARKSRLVPRSALVALVSAEDVARRVPGWTDLDEGSDGSALLAAVYARLTDDYAVTMRAYPEARAALVALLQLHEIENLKLVWRAVVRGIPAARWRPRWRPLGPLEAIGVGACEPVTTADQLVAVLARTPYGEIADAELRAHPRDLAAVELAFDRFGSARLLAAANALPGRERAARDLLRSVVRERDGAMLGRAVGVLGLPPEQAALMAPLLGGELRGDDIVRISAKVSEFLGNERRRRRVACRRAFVRNPFSLAPSIALTLLGEDECRALVSLAELRARRAAPAEARRVLDEQPVAKLPRRTETGDAPAWQGATTENTGSI